MRSRGVCLWLGWCVVLIAQSALYAVDAPTDGKVRIALIGDSTVASYPRPPADRPDLTGWGQVFGEYFTGRVEVLNHAASGRSSKSFLAEGRWEPVLKEKPDYVFIQFGHNDQPGKGDRTTDPNGDFQDNLKRYIREAREAGAVPVLVTPVARRTFVDGKPHTTLTPYAEAMQKVGRETKTPVVDLHAAAFALYEKLGDEGSADLSASATDRTHFSRKGGLAMAGLVAEALPEAAPDLAVYLKDSPSKEDIFTAGEGGYAYYRIPSMVLTPNEVLLVFCEGRKSSRSDDGDIDLLLRRSDSGRKWLTTQLVHEEGGDAPIKWGNPCAVVDHETGVVWLTMNRTEGATRGERSGADIYVTHSDDDGATWSKPVDITDQVKRPDWKHYAQGPGVGIQLRHGPNKGRLIVPANYRMSFNNRDPSYSHVMYSDDHGKTWQLGGIVGPHTNECQLVETLEDGKPGLLFNMRNHWGRSGGKPELAGRRLVSRSDDGGLTWSEATVDDALIEPTCQASIFRYSFADDANGEKSRILFANPAGKSRDHMTVRVSYDEGRTWPVSRLIDAGSSAYSCLARLKDGRVGLVYERDEYRHLTYAEFPIDWLEQ